MLLVTCVRAHLNAVFCTAHQKKRLMVGTLVPYYSLPRSDQVDMSVRSEIHLNSAA